jgi:hypothetical protein
MSSDPQEDKRKEYLEERRLLIEAESQSAQSFDKAMLTLSAGALALSITFIKELAPEPKCLCCLYFAWAGFCISLLSTLASFLTSQSSMRKQRDIVDARQKGDIKDDGGHRGPSERNVWTTTTKGLNWFSIISFILGVVCLVVFATANIRK